MYIDFMYIYILCTYDSINTELYDFDSVFSINICHQCVQLYLNDLTLSLKHIPTPECLNIKCVNNVLFGEIAIIH